jgi:hypothetical protein
MPTRQYGPFSVLKTQVRTGITVQSGDAVRTVAEGMIDFGGAAVGFGAPILNADGDSWSTPDDYPAPSLRKNSLICKVGNTWYQGGTDKFFNTATSGEVILYVNDKEPNDNSRGWSVTLHHTPVGDLAPVQPAQPAQPPPVQPVQPVQPVPIPQGLAAFILRRLGCLPLLFIPLSLLVGARLLARRRKA